LWLSYNRIESLAGVEKLRNLRVLCIGQNNLRKIDELRRLEALPLFEELVLKGNPLQQTFKEGLMAYAKRALQLLPYLKKLDGLSVEYWRAMIDQHQVAKLRGLFDRIDLDKGGSVTCAELSRTMKSDDQVGKLLSIEKGKEEELFAEMDNDGGGDISWDEFLLFFSQRLNQY
jgi:Leucine-rich repeat (LRR) protein